jgi:hypothetical protein
VSVELTLTDRKGSTRYPARACSVSADYDRHERIFIVDGRRSASIRAHLPDASVSICESTNFSASGPERVRRWRAAFAPPARYSRNAIADS